MTKLPAWIGWPNGNSPPGHDWSPGPILRNTALLLVSCFLAFALSVDYVASVGFFLLAILGMYIGFRRGFLQGLTRSEKLLFAIVAAFPIMAIISYLLGTQTNVGFRFLGRDLRFFLFIPVYLVLRWTRPKPWPISIALVAGTIVNLMVAFLQYEPLPALVVKGVTGTHIVFGDLAILSGFMAGTLLLRRRRTAYAAPKVFRKVWISRGLGYFSILGGIAVGVLSESRGGWIAVPPLMILLIATLRPSYRPSYRFWLLVTCGGVLAIFIAMFFITPVQRRATAAMQDITSYFIAAKQKTIETPCVDEKNFLSTLLARSSIAGSGDIKIERLSKTQRKNIAKFGCDGSYGIAISNPEWAQREQSLSLFRGNGRTKQILQNFTILAHGRGKVTVGGRADWIKIDTQARWQRYRATGSYQWLATGNLHVPPGAHLWVIPMQTPRGFYAYALAKSSIGQRLEMWRAAWSLFLKHPIIGAGVGSFEALGERALGHSALRRVVGKYQHAHNDYLTAAATTGLLGLAALLALWITPLVSVWKLAKEKVMDSARNALMTCVVSFALFGLTETMYIHSLVISWYVIVTALMLAIVNESSGRDIDAYEEGAIPDHKKPMTRELPDLVEKPWPK